MNRDTQTTCERQEPAHGKPTAGRAVETSAQVTEADQNNAFVCVWILVHTHVSVVVVGRCGAVSDGL